MDSNDTSKLETTAEVSYAETTADPNNRSAIKDSVPDGLTFDGETVRILYRGDGDGKESVEVFEVVGTDNSGDLITDTVWNRNRSVEERLGITLEMIPGASVRATISSNIRQAVMSATDEYDYIDSTGNTCITEGLSPYMQDLSSLPYVNYEEQWWWNDAIRALSLDGTTFHYIFGDLNVQCYIQTGVIYYNKSLYGNIFGNEDEMYDYVMNGTWTVDLLREKVTAAYSDINGDGTVNAGDTLGMLAASNITDQASHFVQGCALDLYHYDENNKFIIEFDQDRSVLAIEKLSDLFHNTTGVYYCDQGIDGADIYFAEGDYLFFPSRFKRATETNLRNMEDPYGILPYPKLTEAQKEYSSLSHQSGSTVCVPKTVSEKKLEVVGAALEALCSESWRTVMPTFLESALKLKYSHDSSSGKVVDIVVASVTKNTLHEYQNYTSSIYTTCLINPISSGKNNFASAYAKVIPAAQKTWDKIVDNLTK